MDSRRFDALTRRLGSPVSRRSLVGGALASLSGATVGGDAAPKKCAKLTKPCGGKAGKCCPGTKCVKKQCKCPRPIIDRCGQRCVNFQTDMLNCGACGSGCKQGQLCQSGSCQCTEDSCSRKSTIGCISGNCVPCDVCEPGLGCEFNDIMVAMISAKSGDTIHVCPGRYSQIYVEKDVFLIGAGDGEDPETNTIIEGGGVVQTGNVVQVLKDVTAEFQKVRIANGNAFFGGGIWNKGHLTLNACTVTGNVASPMYGGGIVNVIGGSLTMTDTDVTDNHADSINGEGGGIFNDADLVMTNCTLSGNSADGTRGTGGGISNLADATMTNCVVSKNTASVGGGIIVSDGTFNLDNTQVTKNEAVHWGGGIYLGNQVAKVHLSNGSSVSENTPDDCATWGAPIESCEQ